MTDTPAKAIVLGGYGLIGSACMRALAAEGYAVTGVGRSEWAARRVVPDADWVIRDIARVEEAEWRQILAGADVVVNASGAFQESGRDDLTGIHVTAVRRIVAALEGAALEGTNTRLVHISSAGVAPDAPAAFFTTKAAGDAAIMASPLDWVILRPTLVIGPAAYGATGLLRAAAAMPWIAIDVLPDAFIQSVHIGDVAHAVVQAARGDIAAGTLAHVTEDEGRSIRDTIDALRRWLGFAEPRLRVTLPRPLLSVVSFAADLLGRLGWRSPLRSTAIRGLEADVHGDPAVWRAAGGRDRRSPAEPLASMPATVPHPWFAQPYLLPP
ncbi:MAG: NAD(P)H-binding protein, partial [Rhodospirillaceae bacterium]|nr:NAD(P)H-binding protein [Rhodospirillaceae bacterium]